MTFKKQIVAQLMNGAVKHQKLDVSDTLYVLTHLSKVSTDEFLLPKLLEQYNNFAQNTKTLKRLSKRENEIFNLVGIGYTTKEISSRLLIKEDTVSTHRKNIVKKLNISGPGSLQKVAYNYANTKEAS